MKQSLKKLLVILILFQPFLSGSKVIYRQSRLQMQNRVLKEFTESAPFVWQDNLYYLTVNRDPKSQNPILEIYDFYSNTKISSFGQNYNLASVFIQDNLLYVFATKNWGQRGQSEIVVFTSPDLRNYSQPKKVLTSIQNQSFFNTSVTKNEDTGEYIMAVETDEGQLPAFNIRFFTSYDLKNWTQKTDFIFGKDTYVACPAIRFVNGEYYLLYLREKFPDPDCKTCVNYVINIAKSRDFQNWEYSNQDVLTPHKGDGINASDPDLAEFNGQTYLFYSVGDQATWSKLKYAIYSGSIGELLVQYF